MPSRSAFLLFAVVAVAGAVDHMAHASFEASRDWR
jgi:hypothetical protein